MMTKATLCACMLLAMSLAISACSPRHNTQTPQTSAAQTIMSTEDTTEESSAELNEPEYIPGLENLSDEEELERLIEEADKQPIIEDKKN